MIGPPANEKRLLSLLHHCFTPEEAAIAAELPLFYLPASLTRITKTLSMKEEVLKPFLDSMIRKGVIRGKRGGYALLPLFPGIFENVLLSGDESPWHREFVRLSSELFETGYIRRYLDSPAPVTRTIPVNKTLHYTNMQVNLDHMDRIITSHKLMAVLHNCQCRQAAHLKGEECRKAERTDGCLVFGRFAKIFIDRGSAQKVSRQSMSSIVQDRWGKNLTFFTGNVAHSNPNLICTCCDCCCHMLGQIINHDPRSIVTPPEFIAVVDEEKCVHCGKCISSCNLFAHSISDGKHAVKQTRCVGCGLCVLACSFGAITMRENPGYRKPSRNYVQLALKVVPGKLMSYMRR